MSSSASCVALLTYICKQTQHKTQIAQRRQVDDPAVDGFGTLYCKLMYSKFNVCGCFLQKHWA